MKITTIVFLITICFGTLTAQNAWVPDPTFGSNGITRVDFGTNQNDSPNDMLLISGDKILTAGISILSSGDYFIAMSQLLPNGQPDVGAFGTDGEVLLHFVMRDHANAIALQDDEKIVVVGSQAESNAASLIKPSIYRFNSDGSVDTAFANNGMLAIRFDNVSSGQFYGLKILEDEKILAVGRSTANSNGGLNRFGAMRFLPNGSLDPQFGIGGMARLGINIQFNPVSCLFLADTAIVVATVSTSNLLVLAMMDSSGNPHPGFGNGGIVQTNIEAKYLYSGGESLALTNDNKILLSATTPNSNPTKFSVFRFLINGMIDSTFGTNGRTDIQFTSDDVCYDMKITADGKILLVGEVSQGYGMAGIAQLNSDGTPDTTFAPDGKQIVDLNNNTGTHYLTTVLPLQSGDILAGGYDFASNAGDFMVVRLTQNPTGIDDQNFNQPGDFNLYQNYPNPFNPATTIEFYIPNAGVVNLSIYNILGEQVKTLINEERPAGKHSIQFSANNLSGGIYFYKLQAGSFEETKKMILLK